MNTPKRTMLTTALALLLVSQSASFAADTDPTQGAQRAVIGVRLDPHRLPRLLTKHLQLEQGQGLVILNVLKDSPADHAGLDRDDIILTLQGELVTDYRAFVSQIQQAGVGAEVSLDIMHEGQRKTVSVELAAASDRLDWHYPPTEEDPMGPFPGRIWRLDPDARGWHEIPFGQMPRDLHRFFEEQRTYRITEDDRDYEITIEGDPADPRVPITIRDLKTGKEHTATAEAIDKLPEEYRQSVRDTLKAAQKEPAPADRFKFRTPRFFDWPDGDSRSPFDSDMWDRMQRQLDDSMRQWQQRMEELERQNRKQDERLDKLHEPADRPDMEEL